MKLISFHREFGPAEEAGILREDGYVLPLAETDLGIVTMNDLFVKLAWKAETGGDAPAEGYFSPLKEAERKFLQSGYKVSVGNCTGNLVGLGDTHATRAIDIGRCNSASFYKGEGITFHGFII